MSQVRIPTFTDLSDRAQIRELNRVLRELSLATERVTANVEEPRTSVDATGPAGPGIRVVRKNVGPTDPDHDSLSYEAWRGPKRGWEELS